ncbi:iron ABC transporter permease [Iodidimonas sp. SYSU 1G8]|uniref:FecCD family ABC transporter permease n=1 Tax=Iodidimonas sp. SYSU 1G8 TaxID=3133967 RepID=UPI0031FEF5C6
MAIMSLRFGYVPLPASDVLAGLLGSADEKIVTIIRDLRLPRTILALLIGAATGLAGAVLQSLLRNPLAEPSVVGITGGASLGAVIALYFGLSAVFPFALPLSALTGAAIATIVLYLVAARDSSTLTLILVGMAIGGISLSLISLAMNLSPNPWAVSEIIFWLLGSVRDRSFADVTLAAPFIVTGIAVLLTLGKPLDALSLGEEAAQSLGMDLTRVRVLAIVGTSLAVGASVAVAGTIGFVGLVVPHLLRPLVGQMPSRLLLPSALGGAALLAAADVVVRLITVGPELHLGIVTSLIGAPFFLYLILKTRKIVR